VTPPPADRWRVDDDGAIVCEHGTAIGVHCCNCHVGLLLHRCVCEFDSEDDAA
jgi:hypothetical protein